MRSATHYTRAAFLSHTISFQEVTNPGNSLQVFSSKSKEIFELQEGI